eukprot:scaffold487648_cov14-Prasinocladus_malaysianus.AAC.1
MKERAGLHRGHWDLDPHIGSARGPSGKGMTLTLTVYGLRLYILSVHHAIISILGDLPTC